MRDAIVGGGNSDAEAQGVANVDLRLLGLTSSAVATMSSPTINTLNNAQSS